MTRVQTQTEPQHREATWFTDRICHLCGHPVRTVRKGTVLVRAGQDAEAVTVIRDGSVVLRRPQGQEGSLLLLHPGGIIGDQLALTHRPAPWDAVALTEAAVVTIPSREFLSLVDGSAALTRAWMLHTADRVGAHQERLAELLAGDVSARVCRLLLHEFDRGGHTTLTQQVIADLLGVRRSSVSRVIRRLESIGAIDGGYGFLHLRDRARIQHLAGLPQPAPRRTP